MSSLSTSFVLKLKYSAPGAKEESRRYGFSGDLSQKQVYVGLYERTAQAFGIEGGTFSLYAESLGAQLRLSSYDAYLSFTQEVLSSAGIASTRRDEKNRLVLVFHVRREDAVPEPVAASPEPQPDPHQWERDIEAALARSQETLADDDTASEKGRQAFEEVRQARARAAAAAAAPQQHSPPMASVERPSSSLFAGSVDVEAFPYIWSWGHPAPPPPPPPTLLSSLPSHSRAFHPLAPITVPHTDTVITNGPPSAFVQNHKKSVDEMTRRCREFQERKRAMQVLAFSNTQPILASPAVECSQSLSSTGYSPSYAVPPPVAAEEEVAANVEPAPTPEDSAGSQDEKPAGEAWAGVKFLLSTFVRDLNRHLADNFGDEAAGFALRIPESTDAAEPAAASSKIVSTEDQAKYSWQNCFCDGCLKTIVGIRYKCTVCSNSDSCESCIGKLGEFHDAQHKFSEVSIPGALPAAVKQEEPVVEVKKDVPVAHPATCDICDETIYGVRHKCINCPDFDVCESCLATVENVHPHHNFLPITDPSAVKLKVQPGERAIHRHIVCDGCQTSPIRGIRYKCTSPECVDDGGFDLCAACEADPIPRHPGGHHLLKIRQPVSSMATRAAVNDAVRVAQGATSRVPAAHQDLAGLLRTLGISGALSANGALDSAIVGSNARLVDGPDGDRTLVVDLDVDAAAYNLPSVIHVPITIPSAGAPESVVVFADSAKSAQVEPTEKDAQVPEEHVEEVVAEIPEEEVEAEAEVEAAPVLPQVSFLGDVTLVDGSVVPAGSQFTKIWRVKNSGSEAWPLGTKLVNVGGFSATSSQAKEVPLAAPGESVEIAVDMRAPEEDGRHMDHFRLATFDGQAFGDRIWVDITVESDEETLRKSGSLSSSIIAPSMNASGVNGGPPSTAPPSLAASSAHGDFESVNASDNDAAVSSGDDSSDAADSSDVDESSDDDSDDGEEFVVLSGGEQASADESDSDDDEWNAAA